MIEGQGRVPVDRKTVQRRETKVTVDLGSLGSRESLDPKLRTKDWDATGIDKNDLLELEEINFMNKKSVRVRRTAN